MHLHDMPCIWLVCVVTRYVCMFVLVLYGMFDWLLHRLLHVFMRVCKSYTYVDMFTYVYMSRMYTCMHTYIYMYIFIYMCKLAFQIPVSRSWIILLFHSV